MSARRRDGGFANTTFIGDPVTNREVSALRPYLRDLLLDMNGFITFDGAFHVRGVCERPDWHSLHAAWESDAALHRLFSTLVTTDIPFAQDAIGNQFIIRENVIYRMEGETGTIECLDLPPEEFMEAVADQPTGYLPIDLVEQLRQSGGHLAPGELLSVYPPLCSRESSRGVSLRPIPARERLSFLSDFARQIDGVHDGTRARVFVSRAKS